jgi:hypothetical protein
VSDPIARKARERSLLQSFLGAEGIRATVHDRETPDFAIQHDGRLIGVEVTEVFHPTRDAGVPKQANESIARRVVRLAQDKFTSDGGPSLRVSVAFTPSSSTEVLNREDSAQKLADLVRRLVAQPGEVLEWRANHREDLLLASVFSYVHVYRHPASFRSHWLVAAAGWVSPLTAGHLQDRVNEKAKRLDAYRVALPEVWLLLGVWGREPSQFFDLESPPSPNAVRSPFDRTYFYDAFIKKAVPLGAHR